MSGRLENAIKTERTIKRVLEDLPKEVSDYYSWLSITKEAITCKNYIYSVARFIKFATDDPVHFDVRTINEELMIAYIKASSRREVDGVLVEQSFASKKHTHSCLKSFCGYLYKRKIIAENPMELIERPNQEDPIKRVLITKEDFKTILNGFDNDKKKISSTMMWAHSRDKLIFLLLMNTGMRGTALTEIDIEDIDFEKRTLKVTDKRHQSKTYFLNDLELYAIKEWLIERIKLVSSEKKTDALFLTYAGSRVTKKALDKIVNKYTLNYLGRKLSPHKFRSGFCSILYDQTRDIEFVRDAVGHKSSTITQRYIVKKESAQATAANMFQEMLT